MKDVARKKFIFFQWMEWHFFDVPRNILKGWNNFLRFNFEYFSVPLLLKTLFSPWRRALWEYPKSIINLWGYLETFISNVFSRAIGGLLRIVLILLGILNEGVIFFAGLGVLAAWYLMPLLLCLGLIMGVKLLIL